ncbi:N-acetyl-gamma-glutamyl-phosphate reductase [Pedobacter psychrophilus]|uniref:N-acetyl-gamma-glutamyl-phosphate reductase n=1 Tax=Pedobacter psychrophilus TaxID=1826909 RepID=A0A179DC02_9SPHI|nr:N-acetyl-gamma-glutamyl-phosphate reductase [Pedobacter psychrophilus]OAQ38576.1 N-acetyl-gamma-glutamyl-phosphate reductase [Pedobacter psychrophilus]
MMIKVGIIGGAGYTGGELLRILINHPNVEIAFTHSNSNAGNLISDVHTDLLGDTDLKFTNQLSQEIDVLFLCVGHGDARKFLEANPISANIKIIDLSQDFRLKAKSLKPKAESQIDKQPSALSLNPSAFIYGLPELNKEAIKNAHNIANPGCFATCLQLGLLPLAKAGLLKSEVHISATTGSTGAGQKPGATSHFSWRNNNLSVYKAFEHQHLNEIGESLLQLQANFDKDINFIPYRGAFPRGIMASAYIECDLSLEEAEKIYTDFYTDAPFTHISKANIDLKQVVNTNKCLIHLEKHGNKLMIISIIDNLLKGASGQAVQNMNLMFGLEETAGLRLKAIGF